MVEIIQQKAKIEIIKPTPEAFQGLENTITESTGLVDDKGREIVKKHEVGSVLPMFARRLFMNDEDGLLVEAVDSFIGFDATGKPEDMPEYFRQRHPLMQKLIVGTTYGLAALAAFGIIMPGCTGVTNNYTTKITNFDFKMGYATTTLDDPNSGQDPRTHGVYMGGKFYEDHRVKTYIGEGLNTRLLASSNFKSSEELTGTMTFGDYALFEMGYNFGLGFYTPKATSSAEIIIGLPRIGATSADNIMWTPKAGLGFSFGPLDAEVSIDFKVGRDFDVGLGVMVGLGI